MSFEEEKRVISARTVLCWPHRPRVDVHVGIDFDGSDLEPSRLE